MLTIITILIFILEEIILIKIFYKYKYINI